MCVLTLCHVDAYPGCSLPHRCGPCSRRRRRSANAGGCSALGSDTGTRPPGTPSRSRSSGTGTSRCQSFLPFYGTLWGDNWLLEVGKSVLRNGGVGGGSRTDLIWAVEAVVVSITPQTGWDAASAGTHVLVDRTCGENWTGGSQQWTFFQHESLSRDFYQKVQRQPSQKTEHFRAESWGLSCAQTREGMLRRPSHIGGRTFPQWVALHKERSKTFGTGWEASLTWVCWDSIGLSPVPWQFLSSSPILQSSWPSQSHFCEMQRLLRHWNWSSAQRSSQPLYNQMQIKHRININDCSDVKRKLHNRKVLPLY